MGLQRVRHDRVTEQQAWPSGWEGGWVPCPRSERDMCEGMRNVCIHVCSCTLEFHGVSAGLVCGYESCVCEQIAVYIMPKNQGMCSDMCVLVCWHAMGGGVRMSTVMNCVLGSRYVCVCGCLCVCAFMCTVLWMEAFCDRHEPCVRAEVCKCEKIICICGCGWKCECVWGAL